MWELKDGAMSRYRCHIGHAYTEETITTGIDEWQEAAGLPWPKWRSRALGYISSPHPDDLP
jgi:hypothetical protein